MTEKIALPPYVEVVVKNILRKDDTKIAVGEIVPIGTLKMDVTVIPGKIKRGRLRPKTDNEYQHYLTTGPDPLTLNRHYDPNPELNPCKYIDQQDLIIAQQAAMATGTKAPEAQIAPPVPAHYKQAQPPPVIPQLEGLVQLPPSQIPPPSGPPTAAGDPRRMGMTIDQYWEFAEKDSNAPTNRQARLCPEKLADGTPCNGSCYPKTALFFHRCDEEAAKLKKKPDEKKE